MLTEKEYIKEGGNVCPVCESKDIEAAKVKADSATAWAGIQCQDCGIEWREFYSLTGFEIL